VLLESWVILEVCKYFVFWLFRQLVSGWIWYWRILEDLILIIVGTSTSLSIIGWCDDLSLLEWLYHYRLLTYLYLLLRCINLFSILQLILIRLDNGCLSRYLTRVDPLNPGQTNPALATAAPIDYHTSSTSWTAHLLHLSDLGL
jgi:hypothetical protein